MPVRAQLTFAGQAESSWFYAMRPHCNPIETNQRLKVNPPPDTWIGSTYETACHVLAQQSQHAAEAFAKIPPTQYYSAAEILYDIALSSRSQIARTLEAELLRFALIAAPNHSDALYAAGMAEYDSSRYTAARKYLKQFLTGKPTETAKVQRAQEILELLGK